MDLGQPDANDPLSGPLIGRTFTFGIFSAAILGQGRRKKISNQKPKLEIRRKYLISASASDFKTDKPV
jgi:hypothetical protein